MKRRYDKRIRKSNVSLKRQPCRNLDNGNSHYNYVINTIYPSPPLNKLALFTWIKLKQSTKNTRYMASAFVQLKPVKHLFWQPNLDVMSKKYVS